MGGGEWWVPPLFTAGEGLGPDGVAMYNSPPLGQVAQLVEQGTENPRVGGSIPPLAMRANALAQLGLTRPLRTLG